MSRVIDDDEIVAGLLTEMHLDYDGHLVVKNKKFRPVFLHALNELCKAEKAGAPQPKPEDVLATLLQRLPGMDEAIVRGIVRRVFVVQDVVTVIGELTEGCAALARVVELVIARRADDELWKQCPWLDQLVRQAIEDVM